MQERLGWKPGRGLLAQAVAPFDISRPNIHDSKKEFLAERDAVQAAIDHLDGVISAMIDLSEVKDPAREEMINRMSAAVDAYGLNDAPYEALRSAHSLVRRNIRETGLYYTSLLVLSDLKRAFENRALDLQAQEEAFWTVASRPPNYYARAIALRFARFYARQTGKKPTFGTSSDGPHPSTDYGRILEAVFAILGIDANIKSPGEWAISMIQDEDVNPPANALAGLLGSVLQDFPAEPLGDPKKAIVAALSKKGP